MKVLAIVKFNSGQALVLDEMRPMTWQRIGNDLFGTNGVFCQCLFYEKSYPRWEAFGGRKFDIKLEGGEIVHCSGQYWDGVKETHRSQIDGDIVHVTAQSIDQLKDCYVYCGYTAVKSEYDKLVNAYVGPIYDYWDYEKLISGRRGRMVSPKDKKRILRKYKWDKYLAKLLNKSQE